MTAAENRRRLTQLRAGENFRLGDGVEPGMTYPEILYLRKIRGRGTYQSKTEYVGGWQSTSFRVGSDG